MSLLEGSDGIVYFGSKGNEGELSVVRDTNIEGIYNLYDVARQSGCRRIFYPGSIHAVGYHSVTANLDELMTNGDNKA